MKGVGRRLRGFASLRPATLGLAAAASLAAPALAAPGDRALAPTARAEGPTFEQAFDPRGEPARLHYTAVFASRGGEHRVEVWRAGQRRLKRVTDGALETYVTRRPGDAEFRMSVLDLRRRIHTRISRTNMYRIGAFFDWFDLAHALRRPKGAYRLATASPPKGVVRAIQPCTWYDLTQGARTTRVCWSARSRLPLLILSGGDRPQWRVTEVDERPIPPNTFRIHDQGFVRNDANQDIGND